MHIVPPKRTENLISKSEGTATESVASDTEQQDDTPTPSSRPFAELLVDLIGEGSKLKTLSLRGNGLGDGDAVALAQAIEPNTTLCSLNLFDNAITDEG